MQQTGAWIIAVMVLLMFSTFYMFAVSNAILLQPVSWKGCIVEVLPKLPMPNAVSEFRGITLIICAPRR